MPLRVNVTIQLLALFCQLVIQQIPGLGTEWLPFVGALTSFFQAATSLIAQYWNPDGSPAKQAYVSKVKGAL